MPHPTRLSDPVVVAQCLARAAGEGRPVEVRGGGLVCRGDLGVHRSGVEFRPGWPAPAPRPWAPVQVDCEVAGAVLAFPTRALPGGDTRSWRLQFPAGVQLVERRREPRARTTPDTLLWLRIDCLPGEPRLRVHDLAPSGLGLLLGEEEVGVGPHQSLDASLLLPGGEELRLRLRTLDLRPAGPDGRVLGALILLVDRQHQVILDEVVAGLLPQEPDLR